MHRRLLLDRSLLFHVPNFNLMTKNAFPSTFSITSLSKVFQVNSAEKRTKQQTAPFHFISYIRKPID
jgi:hypothetical protein